MILTCYDLCRLSRFRQFNRCCIVPGPNNTVEEIIYACTEVGAVFFDEGERQYIVQLRPEIGPEVWTEESLRRSISCEYKLNPRIPREAPHKPREAPHKPREFEMRILMKTTTVSRPGTTSGGDPLYGAPPVQEKVTEEILQQIYKWFLEGCPEGHRVSRRTCAVVVVVYTTVLTLN